MRRRPAEAKVGPACAGVEAFPGRWSGWCTRRPRVRGGRGAEFVEEGGEKRLAPRARG